MNGMKKLLLAVLVVLSLALIAGCTGQTDKKVTTNENVTVDYTGWLDDGTVFDTSNATVAQQAGIYNPLQPYEPISFVTGSGDVIEGFDSAVTGMKIGESKEFNLTPEQAYGAYNTSLISPIPMKVLTDNNITPEVNATLYYGTMPVRVVSIPNNTTVMIDFNHPLAGKALHFRITVLDIQPAANSST